MEEESRQRSRGLGFHLWKTSNLTIYNITYIYLDLIWAACQELYLFLCWDHEGEETQEDSILDSLFQAVDADEGASDVGRGRSRRKGNTGRKSSKKTKKDKKKRKASSTSSSSASSSASSKKSSASSSKSSSSSTSESDDKAKPT